MSFFIQKCVIILNKIIMMDTNQESRSQIVKKKIKELGFSFKEIGEYLGLSTHYVYLKLSDDNLDFKTIKTIGDFIGYNFAFDFEELRKSYNYNEEDLQQNNVVQEESAEYWRKKYINVLEKLQGLTDVSHSIQR